MAESEKKETKKPDGPTCDRALVCPDEWEDPKGRKVLGEFHKEGLPEGLLGVDADLERFEEYWSKKGSVNIQGKYHKEGAPYLEDKEGRGADRSKIDNIASPNIEEEKTPPRPAGASTLFGTATQMPPPRSERAIDLAAAEVISYALFRAAFANGIRIPIKMDKMVDADLTIRGKDIIINTNELYTNIPDLAIWRVIYTHKGKPVFEFGRGIKKGLKVHRLNALRLGFLIWRQTRAKERAKLKLQDAREKAALQDASKGAEKEES